MGKFKYNQIMLEKGKKILPFASRAAVTSWETKGLSSDFSSFSAALLGTPCRSQWPDAKYSFMTVINTLQRLKKISFHFTRAK